MTRPIHTRMIATTTFLVAACASVASADWPNFRGPNHDGISPDTGFRKTWDEALPLKWEREIGSAFSSFAVVGDRLYTCGTAEKQQVLYCLSTGTGEIIWQTPIERAYRDNFGDGTRATPTVADGRVYILGGHGRLLCVDAKTGSEVWDAQFHHVPQWGYSGSVLVEGDLAIATAGNDQGTLVAFDKATGEKRWQCGDDPAGQTPRARQLPIFLEPQLQLVDRRALDQLCGRTALALVHPHVERCGGALRVAEAEWTVAQ